MATTPSHSTTTAIIHRATGDTAEVLHLAARTNHHGDIPTHLDAAVASLTYAGVLAPSGITGARCSSPPEPAPPTATSPSPPPPTHSRSAHPAHPPPTTAPTFWTDPGFTSVTIQAWGGGGRGGRWILSGMTGTQARVGDGFSTETVSVGGYTSCGITV